jgi:hypothetical protein
VAIDGSKFKAVNNRDRNFTAAKMKRRMEQIEESVERYLQQLDSADQQEPSLARTTKMDHLQDKIAILKREMERLEKLEAGGLRRPTSRSLSPIPMLARWRHLAGAAASSVTMSRRRWTPNITRSLPTR